MTDEYKMRENLLKRNEINSIISQADIFLIQYSKLKVVDEGIASCFWRKVDVGWYFSKSQGALEGDF